MQDAYRVFAGLETYGYGSREDCAKIVSMHKNAKNGARKEAKSSTMNFQIEPFGEYPPKNPPKVVITYKTGRVPTQGELK